MKRRSPIFRRSRRDRKVIAVAIEGDEQIRQLVDHVLYVLRARIATPGS